jgi:hypothetical protein
MAILKDEMARLGGPAFPVVPPSESVFFSGMSLRDYFAAAAISGLSANTCYPIASLTVSEFAVLAYKQADAMLAARERKEGLNG